MSAKTATSKRVDLAWTGTAASYVVQRRTLGGTYSDLTTVSSTSASDTQVDPYTTYQYQVLAAMASGRSAPSNEITVGPPPAGYSSAAPAPMGQAGSYGFDLSLVLDGNGDPAFAFLFDDPNQDTDHSDTQLLFRSWNRAKYAWNPVVKVGVVGDVATGFYSTVSLAYDSSTSVFGLATETNPGDSPDTVKLYTSTDGGSTWTLKNTFQEDMGSGAPSLVLANGNLYLAYQVSHTGIKYVTGKFSAASSTWQSKTAPVPANTDVALEQSTLTLALDSAGNPGIAYAVPDTTQSYNTIVFFWRPSGGNPVRIMDSQNQQTDASVGLKFYQTNPRVGVYLLRSDAPFGVGLHFSRSDDGGNTWSKPVVIPPDGDSTTDHPFSMDLDSQDHGVIAFGQNGSSGDQRCGNPKVSLSSDLVNWITCSPTNDAITNDFDSYPGAIAASYGGNDKLYLLWWQQGDNGAGTGIVMWRQPPSVSGGAPSIQTTNGVVHGATFQPGIVAGSWVSILGANFSDISETWANADFSSGRLPTNLNGLQVNIGGSPAAIYYVSQTQLNVQAPAGISGDVAVQVIRNGVSSNTVTASTVANAPGLFTYPLGSNVFPAAVFLDGVIVGDPALAASTRKAKAGDRVLLYATGLVASPAGVVINAPAAVSSPVKVTIGTSDATVEFAGLTAPGEFQINIVVPNLPPGNYPLTLSIAGQNSQAGVTMPIGQ